MIGAFYRGVEQLVARRAHNPKVVGSNPTPASNLFCSVIYKNVVVFLNSNELAEINLKS